jgi:hypothetical protein
MARKNSEHDALKGVDELLAPLTPEEQQRVLDWLAIKYKLTVNKQSAGGSGAGNPSPGVGSGNIPKDITVKDFLALKKPIGFYERIACLAFHLERYQGKESEGFKTADITQANTDAKLSKIPDPSVYTANAMKAYGYLISIGKGNKSLSARGEAVASALPDREGVELAHQNHPMKRAKSKKKKGGKS